MLLVMHDIGVARKVNYLIAVPYNGRVVENAQPHNVIEHLQHTYTNLLIYVEKCS